MQAHVNTWRLAISSSICRFARPAEFEGDIQTGKLFKNILK